MATEGDGPVAISISTGEGLDRTLKIEKLVNITDKHPELHTEKQVADDENVQLEYIMEVAGKNSSFETSEGEIFLDPLSEITQVEQSNQAGVELPNNEVQPRNGGEVGGHVQTGTEETEVIEERKEKFTEAIENHDIVTGAGHISEIAKNGDAKLDVEEVEESANETTLNQHIQKISNQQDSIKEDVQCLAQEADISEADIQDAEKKDGNAESYNKEASDLLQETTFQEYEAPVSTHYATDRSFKKDVELETNVTPTDEVDSHQPMQTYEQTEEIHAFAGVTSEDAKTESAFENADVISCTEETREIQHTPEFSEKEEATPVECPKENDTITEEVSESTNIAPETVEYALPEIQTAENQPQEFIEEKSRDYEASVEAAQENENSPEEQAIQETPFSLVEEETTLQITKEEEVQATKIKEEEKEADEKCEEPIEVADATKEIGNEAIEQRTETNRDVDVPIPEEEAYAEESTKPIAEGNTFLSEVSEVTTKEVIQENHSIVSDYGLESGEVNEVSALEEAAVQNKEHVNYTPEQKALETTLIDEVVVETVDHAQKEESYKSETIEKDIQTPEDEGNTHTGIAPAECLATIAPDQSSLHTENIELQKAENVNSMEKFEEQTPAAAYEGEKGFVESQLKNDEHVTDADTASEETESKDINVQEQKCLSSKENLEKQIPAVKDEGEACMKKYEKETEQETLPTTAARELPLDVHADECFTAKYQLEEPVTEAADKVDTSTKEADEEIKEQAESTDSAHEEKITVLVEEKAFINEEVESQLEEHVSSSYGMEEQIPTTAEEGDIDLKEAGEDNKELVCVTDFSPDVKAKDIEAESCSGNPQEENKDIVTYAEIIPEDITENLQEQVQVVAHDGDTILNEAEENKENLERRDNSPETESQSEENVSSTDNLEKHIPALADDAECCLTEAESEYKEHATITDITSEVKSVPTILTDQTVLKSEEVELPAEENVVSADDVEKEIPTADEGECEAISTIAEAESEEQVSVTDTTQDKGIATTLTSERSLETEEAYVLPKIADNSNENLEEISASSELGDTCLKMVDENENKEQVEEKSPATILTEETKQDIEYTDTREDSNSEEILEKQIPAAVYEAETDLKEEENEKHVEHAEIAAEGKGLPTILVDETPECIEVTDVQAEIIDSKEILEEKCPIAFDEGVTALKEAEADIKEQVETTDIVPDQKGVETILGDEAHEGALVLEEVHVQEKELDFNENVESHISATIVEGEADSNKGEVEYKEIKCTEVSAEDTDVKTILGDEADMEIQGVDVKADEMPEEAGKCEESVGVLDDHIQEYIPEDATEQIKDDDCNAVKSENEILEDSETIEADEICEIKDVEKSGEVLPVKYNAGQQEECCSPAPTEALKDENITEDTSAEVVPLNDAEASLEVLEKYETEAAITNLPDLKPKETTPGPSGDNVEEVICTNEETQESLSTSTREVETTTTEALPEIKTVEEEEEKTEGHAEGAYTIAPETLEHETIPEENIDMFSLEKEIEKEIQEEYSSTERSFDETPECIEVTDVQDKENDSKEVLEEQSPIALDEGVTDLTEAEADIKEQEIETTDFVSEQKGVETMLSDETHERTQALEEVHVQEDKNLNVRENVESQIPTTIGEGEADSKEGELEYKEKIKCTEVVVEDTGVTTIIGEEVVMEIQSVEAKEEEKPEEACKGEESTGVLDDHIREYIPEDATEQIKDDDCNAVKSENEILEDSQTIADEICETKDVQKSEEVLPVKYDGGQQEECSTPAPIEALKEENITEETSAEVVPSNDEEYSLEVPEVVITNLPDVKPEETTPGPSNDNVEEVICTKEETQESLSISTQEVEATTTEALPEIQTVEEKIIEKSEEVLLVKHDGDQQEERCSPTPTEALKNESINEYTSAEVVATNDAEDSLEVLRDYESEAVTTNLPDVKSVEATPGPSIDNVEEVICTKEETRESLSTSTREVETTEALPEIQTVEEEKEKIEGRAEGTYSIVEARAETLEHERIPEEENINSFSSENEIGKEIHEYSSRVRSFDTDVKCDEVNLTESTTEDKEQVDSTRIAREENHTEGIHICKNEPVVETLVEEGTTISEVQDETDNSEDATKTNNKICEEVQDEPVIIDRDFRDDKIIDKTLTNLNTEPVEENKIVENFQGEEEEIEQLNGEGSSLKNVNEGNDNDISAECVSDVTNEKVKECIEEAVECKEEITEDNAETLIRELISDDTIQNSQDIVQETIELKEENASGLLTENNEDALKSEKEILQDPETEETVSTLPVVQLLMQKHESDEYELPKLRDVLPEEMKPQPSNENAEVVTCTNMETEESLDKENDTKESDTSTEEACIVGDIEENSAHEVSSQSGEVTTEESFKEEKIEVHEDCKEVIDAKEEDSTDITNTEELIGEAIVEATPQLQTYEEVAQPVSTVEDETEKSYDDIEQSDKISEEVPHEPKITDTDEKENVTICARGSVEEEDVEDDQADAKPRSTNEEESSIETPGEGNADEVSTECVPEVTVEESTKEATESKEEVLEESQEVDDPNGAEVLPEADTEVTSIVEEPSEIIEKVEAEVYDVKDKVYISETNEEVTSKEVEVSHVSLEKLNTDAPEEETVERCEVVPESDTKGIDEIAEVEFTADQAFSNKGLPKEPPALLYEEKELIASENEQTKEVEIPTEEDVRDILDTKSEEVICLPEEPRDLEVSTFTPEKLDAGETEEESKETSETVAVSYSESIGVVCEDETVTDQTQCAAEEKLEDYVSVKETLDADASEEETNDGAAIVPEVDSESHDELVKEETNALPEEKELEASEYGHVPKSVEENIEEEKPKEVEMPADEEKQESSITMSTEPCLLTEDPSNIEPALHTPDACETEQEVKGISETVMESGYPSIAMASEDEIVADQTVCEEITETPLSQEKELAASELALEELDTVEEIKEAPEVVPILDSELIEVVSSDETYSEGIIKEEIQSPSSTLLPEEKEHETAPQEKSTEQDYIEEVEVSANEETQTLLDTSPVEKECLQKEEPSEQLEESNETSETVSTFPSIIAETKEENTVDETISKVVTDLTLEVPSYTSLDEEKESKASECDQQKLDADTPEEKKGNEEIPLSVSHIICEASKDEIVADQLEEASSSLVSDQKELKASEQEHETIINDNLEEVKESTDEASEYVFVARSMEEACPQKEEPSELQVPAANETEKVKETFEEVAEYDSQSIKEVSKDDTIADQTVSDVITEMSIPDKIEEVKAELAPEKLDTEAIKDVKEDSEVISRSDFPSIDVAVSDEISTDQALPETTLLPEEKELKQTDGYEHASATLDKNLEEEYAKETEVFADEDTKDVIESSSEETMHLQEENSRELKVSELSPECEEKLAATFESTDEASKEDVVAEELLHQYDEQLLVSPTLVPTEKEEVTMHKEVETEGDTKEAFESVPEVSSQSVREVPTDEIVDQIPSSTLIYEEKRCDNTSIINNAGEESMNVVETPTDEGRKDPHSAEETSIPNEDSKKINAPDLEFPTSPYTERDSSNEVKNLEVATPDSRAEDSYQTPIETNPTSNIEVLNKEIIDEKEIAEVSDFTSVAEENVRESQQENESREEKYPEEKSDTVTASTEYHQEVSEVDETGSLSRDIKGFKDYSPNEKEELSCQSSTAQVIYPVEKDSSLEISQGVLDVEEANGDKKQREEESHATEIPSSKDEILNFVYHPEFEENKPSDDSLVASESKEEKLSEAGTAEVDSTSAQISLSEKLKEEQTNERVLHDHEDEEDEDEDEDEEKEDTEHKQASHGYDEPVIVEASRDNEVRVSTKKSHNILSGMGKSVKHSISKVKKAIIGKSSNSKTQPDK